MSGQTLTEALGNRRVVVCVGSGGVGKTTVAASIALRAALEGKRALVVTIDPARRLANSMGLKSLGNVEARVGAERFARAGLKLEGELWAMMLDVKRTCDDMIARHAPTTAQAEAIFKNRFYQTASTVLAGSQEYMAMEKLYELHQDERFDLIVLDTPPTAHALDFLDAPNRLIDAFGNDSVKWIATPAVAAGKIGFKAVGLGGGYLARQISRFTGVETLQALAEFLMSMRGMYDGFKDRAGKVKALLASEETRFVLVTAPSAMTLDEAGFFYTTLTRNEMPVGAVVVNRVHPDWRGATGSALDAQSLTEALGADLAARVADAVNNQQILADADRSAVEGLAGDLEPRTVIRPVPTFHEDIHDLSGLSDMGRWLFDGVGAVPASALPDCGNNPTSRVS